jgi:parvulin-like peptidyl-prolyl isomerase
MLVLLAHSHRAAAQVTRDVNLSWQQRFLGILPLVKPDPADPIVVTVNGTPITAAQVNDYAKVEAQLINATSTAEQKATWRDAVDNLINRQLLIDEAKRRGITIPDAQVAQRAREFQITSVKGQRVSNPGPPDATLLNAVRGSMLIEKMLDTDFSQAKVRPTDQQVKKYYDEHKDLFIKDPGEVQIAHIAVRLPRGASAQQKKEAWDKITRLFKEAQATKDFATLAKKSSEDEVSAPKGGDLGFFRRGQLPPIVEKQAFNTPVGKLSDILESNLGYSFMKIVSRRGVTYQSLAEVKPKVAMVLLEYNQDDVVKSLLRKLNKQAKIQFRQPTDRNA